MSKENIVEAFNAKYDQDLILETIGSERDYIDGVNSEKGENYFPGKELSLCDKGVTSNEGEKKDVD